VVVVLVNIIYPGGAIIEELVEICQFGDLIPQVCHDLLVLLEDVLTPLSLGLDDGVADSQALEVVLVQEPVVVDVVHIAHDELDAVVPTVSHCV